MASRTGSIGERGHSATERLQDGSIAKHRDGIVSVPVHPLEIDQVAGSQTGERGYRYRIDARSTARGRTVESTDHTLDQVLVNSTSWGDIEVRGGSPRQGRHRLTIPDHIDTVIDFRVDPGDGHIRSLNLAGDRTGCLRIDSKVAGHRHRSDCPHHRNHRDGVRSTGQGRD